MKAIEGIRTVNERSGRHHISVQLNSKMKYVKVCIMTCDAHAYLYTLLEYDPTVKKEVEFVNEFVAYVKKHHGDYSRNIAWFNGRRWMSVQTARKIKNAARITFDGGFYRDNTRYNLQSIDYLLKYYVGSTKIFFYYSQSDCKKVVDDCYLEWKKIKEKYTGKKYKIPKVGLSGH